MYRKLFIAFDKKTMLFLSWDRDRNEHYWQKDDFRAYGFRSEHAAREEAVKLLGTSDAEERIVVTDS